VEIGYASFPISHGMVFSWLEIPFWDTYRLIKYNGRSAALKGRHINLLSISSKSLGYSVARGITKIPIP